MQIGQDELSYYPNAKSLINRQKRQLVIIQLNYLHIHIYTFVVVCVCVCVFGKTAH